MASTKPQVDEVTVSVVWNKLMNITREVGERVVHSAQSYVMANARDLGPVLLSDKGHIICQVEFLPCHCLLSRLVHPLQPRYFACQSLDLRLLQLAVGNHIRSLLRSEHHRQHRRLPQPCQPFTTLSGHLPHPPPRSQSATPTRLVRSP